jgi:hypothetical protein
MRATLSLALFSAATVAAQPTIAPTPASPSNSERNVGGYTLSQSFELGYRFNTVGGNQDRYRSDVNYGNGVRLLGSTLNLHSLEGHGRLFDELTLSTQGLGNDPYQSSSLRLQQNKVYRYNLNWRINDYVNPGLRGVFGAHAMNTRRQWQDHDVVLLPSLPIQFLFGASRNTQNGPALSSLQLPNSAGDEFTLFSNIQRKQSEYRTGVQVGSQRFRLLLLRGWQSYNETAGTAIPAATPGYNTTNNIVLNSFTRSEPYSGRSPFWRGNLSVEPSRWAAINARFDYAAGRRDFRVDESALGTDRFSNNLNRQTLVRGTGTRPVTSGSVTVSLFPADKFTVTNQTAFHQIQMTGNSTITELNNGTQGLNLIRFDYLGIRTALNSTDVNVHATKWLGVFGGFTVSDRRIRSTEAETFTGGTDRITAEQSNRLKAATGGFRLKPAKPVTVVLDGEVGRADRPFLPVSDRNYHAFGARAQYHTDTLTLVAATRLNYNTNSASLTSFSSKARNSSVNGTWTPNYRFSLDAGYAKLHLDTLGGINYFASGLQSGLSRYVSNIHSTHATAQFSPHNRLTFFLGFSRVQDTGDGRGTGLIGGIITTPLTPAKIAASSLTSWQVFPLSFTSPQARVSVHLRSKLTWNLGYQHYKYAEQASATQNYRAHTGYTSLLWSF